MDNIIENQPVPRIRKRRGSVEFTNIHSNLTHRLDLRITKYQLDQLMVTSTFHNVDMSVLLRDLIDAYVIKPGQPIPSLPSKIV